MKYLRYLSVFMVCFIAFNVSAETLLTKQTLQTMVVSLDNAIEQQDAEAVFDHFAEDAVIILRFSGGAQSGIKLDAKAYYQRLKQAWSMPMEYKYSTENLMITLAEDGQSAKINDRLIESVTFDGEEVMTTETIEHMDVLNQQGLPKIVRLEGMLTIR